MIERLWIGGVELADAMIRYGWDIEPKPVRKRGVLCTTLHKEGHETLVLFEGPWGAMLYRKEAQTEVVVRGRKDVYWVMSIDQVTEIDQDDSAE